MEIKKFEVGDALHIHLSNNFGIYLVQVKKRDTWIKAVAFEGCVPNTL